tara:strand:- start:2616 stop:3062 length:447 start_codon:yes stop_codon:yes gene_type:complete
MASVIHRTTFQYLGSADTPNYPEPTWKHNPDMSQVVGLAKFLWKWDAGTERPIPQTAGEQAATILERLESSRDDTISSLDGVEDILRAMASLLVTEFNAHTDKINAILDAADNANNLSTFKAAMGAIADQPTRTLSQFRTAIRNNLGS